MTILFAESEFWTDNLAFREKYAQCIRNVFEEVAELLSIPDDITFVCQATTTDGIIPETGDGAYTKHSRLILLSLDPGLPYGEDAALKTLRAAVFHELNHASRFENVDQWHNGLVYRSILEGLATAFERDYAPAKPLWGMYKASDIDQRLNEVQDNNDIHDHYEYMFRHEDGRRWIGYKVGTYIVDEAVKQSGKSILELTTLECDEILTLAGIDRGPTKKL